MRGGLRCNKTNDLGTCYLYCADGVIVVYSVALLSADQLPREKKTFGEEV